MTDIECKSEMGITIGLIESILTAANLLGQRLDYETLISGERGDEHQPIRDAIADLCACEPLRRMLNDADARAMSVIHHAAKLFEEGKLVK